MYLLKGKPVFDYNMLILAQYRWEGQDALTPGKHTIVFDYTYDGPGIAKGGTGVLKVDGKVVATGKQANSIAFLQVADETFDVGVDTRTGVNDKDYQVPFAFNGKIDKLTVKLGPPQILLAGTAEGHGGSRREQRTRAQVEAPAMLDDRDEDVLRKLLAFAAVAEMSTGLVLLVIPAIVVRCCLGRSRQVRDIRSPGSLGIALLALGLACWPSRQRAESGSPAFRGMLTYNVLVALFLAYLSVVVHLGGVLLWPGVALHAVVALLLVWTWRKERRNRTSDI